MWKRYWQNKRITLTVRPDSVSGLTVVLKLKSTGEAPSLVARELAVDLSRTTYMPAVVEHIPGVANVVADVLSRYDAPTPGKASQEKHIPACLIGATLRACPPRPKSWWVSLAPP